MLIELLGKFFLPLPIIFSLSADGPGYYQTPAFMVVRDGILIDFLLGLCYSNIIKHGFGGSKKKSYQGDDEHMMKNSFGQCAETALVTVGIRSFISYSFYRE